MRLATRFKLMALFSAAIVALIVLVLLSTSQRVQRELVKNETAGEVLNAVTALRYLTQEYVLRHEERSEAQWQLRSASLAKLLGETEAFGEREEMQILAGLRRTHASLDKLFDVLVAQQAKGQQGAPERAVAVEFESRLSGQIANKVQLMIVDALRLSELSRRELLAAQQRASVAVVLFGVLVMLVVLGTALAGFRSVARPLLRLREGTALVGAGNLDFRLNLTARDEIGDLARAFDGMTRTLQQTTVSRDTLAGANAALQSEMAQRAQAEARTLAQLGRLNLLHQITRSVGERQDLRSIFQVVVRSLEDQLPIDFGCICLYDRGNERLVVSCVGLHSAALALEFPLLERTHIPIDANGLGRCVQGHLVYEGDIGEVDFPLPKRLARGGLRALVLAPLLVESHVFGVLVAARTAPESFSSGECEFLRQLSEHVALAANQSELYAALQRAYDEMRQTQQAALQQERLRALGQMASGIAHDINNAISPVVLYTESLLETEAGLSAKARTNLEVIKRAIDDVAATVARMREFYRAREPQASQAPVDLNRLMQQVADLTRARWNDLPQQRGVTIRLAMEPLPDLPAVMGMEGEIREALTNLVFNAVDAMPEGGQLTMRTRLMEGAARRACVEVADSGVGMDEDTRRRCLEPFFTTKGERGTGLGLAMVYGMVERHGAGIEILSTPGKGTTMRVGFDVPASPEQGAPQAPVLALRRSVRILAVDDDPLVLKSLRDILEQDGHRVVAADGGQAGIDSFRAAHTRGEPYELVITDLGMPYVDGRRVAQSVKQLSPSTPVILLTGWGQRIVAEGDMPVHVDRVLGKPPKLRELREALAACCEEEA
ncbi:ATP-binding protein [Pseudoduganella namucuonensis]|uniref:histidine kinase n=1 Tax=Pseudoduganella namucuonensis TaxID=1035707 RepID=A0A1I7F6F8_9BURK|nr:ATP-binding protein [Pseudoduganella namucuonensis]SFU31725.1 His Kinase A (phospho-acceptor) domain-containing protein [Pseudoduganella namucuonensis]